MEHMKTYTTLGLSLLMALFLSINSTAQNSDYPAAISVFGGAVDYYGDFDSHTVFDFGGENTYFNFGLGIDLYANKYFDLGLTYSNGELGHKKADFPALEGQFNAFDVNMKYKLNNGGLIKEDARIAPYIFAGGGVTDLKSDEDMIVENLYSNFNYGLGFNIPLTERLNLDIRNTYKYMSTDLVDFSPQGLNDNYMTLTAGLKLNLGKVKDMDGDGISDKNDSCPEVAGIEALMGCPDSDSDGIADGQDACPNAAGPAEFGGCPDSDADGVPDKDDVCPDIAGVPGLAGCPDSDGDGVADREDACPDTAGETQYNGCPDSDADGISDDKDKCPQVAGTASTMGCPDKDADGVADGEDKCPNEAGLAANKGCPEVSEEVKEVFTQALKGIQFESGRDVIKSSSYGILNNVVDIMKANPAYKLYIQGHTDSQGDDAMNLDLSKRRANAVMKYLSDRGVAANRLRAEGFGETKPVADNGTAAGRAKNRRVEFKVEF